MSADVGLSWTVLCPSQRGQRSLAVVISIFIFSFWGLGFMLIQCCDAGLGCFSSKCAIISGFAAGDPRLEQSLGPTAAVCLSFPSHEATLSPKGTALMHTGAIRGARNHSVVHVWGCRH